MPAITNIIQHVVLAVYYFVLANDINVKCEEARDFYGISNWPEFVQIFYYKSRDAILQRPSWVWKYCNIV